VFNIDGKFLMLIMNVPTGGDLGSGKLEGKLVTCTNDGWQFVVTDGKCITVDRCDDGCLVETYLVKIENDEMILSWSLLRNFIYLG
jgi:nitrite reductase/ring-hydroxylating ferredoxin subunit